MKKPGRPKKVDVVRNFIENYRRSGIEYVLKQMKSFEHMMPAEQDLCLNFYFAWCIRCGILNQSMDLEKCLESYGTEVLDLLIQLLSKNETELECYKQRCKDFIKQR